MTNYSEPKVEPAKVESEVEFDQSAVELPDFEVVGALEDLAFGGGSDYDDGYRYWRW